jgi:predicted metal-binding protein
LTGKIKAEVIKYSDEWGVLLYVERLENKLKVSDMEFSQRNKKNCEACKRYGANLACPPYSPYFPEYIKDNVKARVICYRTPLEQFRSVIIEECYHAAFKKVSCLLSMELLACRNTGELIAGSGACQSCSHCAIEQGETHCRTLDRQIFSLESLGVNVVSLSEKAFGIKLEWSGEGHTASYVSALGATFL